MFKRKKLKVVFLASSLAFLTATMGLLLYSLTSDLSAPDSSAAGEFKYNLAFKQPASAVGLAAGDTLKLKIQTTLPQGTNNPSTAEFIVKFDKAKLKGIRIAEGEDYLGLNKKVDNTTGTITLDVARIGGSANHIGTFEMAEIEFEILEADATAVKIDPASTFGFPNNLDYAGSVNTLNIAFTQTQPEVEKPTKPEEKPEEEEAGEDYHQPPVRTHQPAGSTTSGTGQKPRTQAPSALPDTKSNEGPTIIPPYPDNSAESGNQSKKVTKWSQLLEESPVEVPDTYRLPLLYGVIGLIGLGMIVVVLQILGTLKVMATPSAKF